MGEVYKARDTRLDRTVAIKVLPERIANRQDLHARFEREARAIASLNHPNICSLFDIGPGYMVMELIEGETLAARIEKGVLPLDQALKIAAQLADALDRAHRAGVTHRDVKPQNIMLTRDGVKVLDFGLAKSESRPGPEEETLTKVLTTEGTVLGTPQYMAPEQFEGKEADARSDVWAFGAVLYEMVTGRKAFEGKTYASLVGAILASEPAPMELTPITPAWLERLVRRCLAKDPEDRWQSMRDIVLELRSPPEVSAAPAIAVAPANRRSALPWILVLAALLAGAALALVLLPTPENDLAAYKFRSFARQDNGGSPAWSPDGKSLAFVLNVHGITQVFIKAIDSREPMQLTHGSTNCVSPFWSRDGSAIYYTAGPELWSVPASGGAEEKRMENAGGYVSLYRDGKTVAFVRQNKVYLGSLEGGEPREFPIQFGGRSGQVTRAQFAPDGSKLAVIEGGSLWIVKYPSGMATKMAEANLAVVGQAATWLPDSRRLMYRGAGRVLLLDTQDGSRRVVYASESGLGSIAVSPDGNRLAYVTGRPEWDVIEISLPSAQVRTVMAENGVISFQPDWHPSGTHFLVAKSTILEDVSATGEFSRTVQNNTGSTLGAHVSPDGAKFVFGVGSIANGALQLMISSFSGGVVLPLDPDALPLLPAWSPDGQWLAYVRNREGRSQLVKRRPGSPGQPVVMVDGIDVSSGVLRYPWLQWSSTGDWILFPQADGMWLVSPDGQKNHKLTERPFSCSGFSKDGAQVIGVFQDNSGKGPQWVLYALDVRTGAEKFLGPLELPAVVDAVAGFSLHPDGKRFLTSIAKRPYDIWILEGFDTPPKSLLDRLRRR
jgi:eukaryotic-like serine/threonine-protein kinase